MKQFKKCIIAILTILIVSNLVSCTNKTNVQQKLSKDEALKLDCVTVGSFQDNKIKLLELNDNKLVKVGELSNVSDLAYKIGKPIYVYIKVLNHGVNLSKNEIVIINKNKKVILKDLFSVCDLNISTDGEYLAYRGYSKDSLESAVGLVIYDINNNKKISMKSDVLVSGNLYNWFDNNNILYYGIKPDGSKVNAIFKYNLRDEKEKPLININGYCNFFIPYDDKGIMYLERESVNSRLYYYDLISNKKILLNNNFDRIVKGLVDTKTNTIYFIGREMGISKYSIYKYSIDNKNISKLNYDFPKVIDERMGMAKDFKGNLYFCGSESQGVNCNDVYYYKVKDDSINLLTEISGYYNIFNNGL